MNRNMGSLDKVIRIVLAFIIFVLIITNQISGILAIVLGVFGAVFFITGLIGTCPLYMLLNISSRKQI